MPQAPAILTINPGSTSTKVALFAGEQVTWSEEIDHDPKELAAFPTMAAQLPLRQGAVERLLARHEVPIKQLGAVVGRGGLFRPLKGGTYRVDVLPTTCHVYFGAVTGATPEGRHAELPVSEGISPVQGADRSGPTAVVKSMGKMDHIRTGGTLLNMKFIPQVLEGDENLEKLLHLVRGYFKLDGHHIQFNVVGAETLREAQRHPEEHRDLIVRVAGYSDYFCDLSRALQDEIIARTEQAAF